MTESSPLMQDNKTVKELGSGRFLRLVSRGTWEYVHRTRDVRVTVIVAVTDAPELVLVEQFRPSVNAKVIELPAGLAGDEPGLETESLEDAARRELLEETGFEAHAMRQLPSGPVSPGITSEEVSFFHATGLRKVGEGGGTVDEEITVHVVPLNEVEQWTRARSSTGAKVDLKVFAGLYFAQNRLPL